MCGNWESQMLGEVVGLCQSIRKVRLTTTLIFARFLFSPRLINFFSGVINQRLCHVASSLGWLSPEQKGFLPGVQGIQEHTHLIQTTVEEAKAKRKGLAVCWMDLRNAFSSVPHGDLDKLVDSFRFLAPFNISYMIITKRIPWTL